MKILTLLLTLFLFTACNNSTNESSGIVKVDTLPGTIFETDGAWADTIPPDGTYRYDVAFAEWEGKSMGEKVTVVIIGKSKSDAQADDIGGCSGGPTVIDFKGRKYWMC